MSDEFDRRRILVVDDEERMVRFIRMNLEHDGFQVSEAFNGKQAIQKLRDINPDLILLDVMMPDIDLTPYQAYASGVSRLHAVVKRDSERVLVMDLGSSNGTYVNGRRINPHVEEALNHGDILALGKLKIQVLLRNI